MLAAACFKWSKKQALQEVIGHIDSLRSMAIAYDLYSDQR